LTKLQFVSIGPLSAENGRGRGVLYYAIMKQAGQCDHTSSERQAVIRVVHSQATQAAADQPESARPWWKFWK